MEEKDEGISLGEIFHVIFIKKWLLLAITIAVMLVGVLFVELLYNPGRTYYQATFQIKFPDAFKVVDENIVDDTRHYPDGTEFLYEEIVSMEFLKKAQSKSEEFLKINVEKMKKENDISIQEYEAIINNESVKTQIYTIYISKKYFSSKDQAADFFETLINIPTEIVLEKSKTIDYDRYLKQFTLVDDYATQMDILINQKDLIISNYESLITKYSTAHSITLEAGTKSISEAQSDIESYFMRYDLSAMKNEVEHNGYVKPDSEFLITIRNRKTQLERELAENNLKLENLNNQIKGLAGYEGQTLIIQDLISEISKITERNAIIQYTIDEVYNRYLDEVKEPAYQENLENFVSRMNEHYEKLMEFTDIYAAFNNEIYETNTKAIISAGSVIVEEGGISLLITLAVTLVAGFVLGCCLNLCLDLPKFLKEKKQAKEEKPEEPNLVTE
ncbi:MAG: hypothetical protein NC310_03410 [Roseburia sp.]|nr:hypothetical protein [Anaeroplasma bactoclasticum]MCM1196107.1 hypothetical protein [Roseburia sp.]MCM1557901.1 hypothetical protein [Anaeroplasma bactoclasticum]